MTRTTRYLTLLAFAAATSLAFAGVAAAQPAKTHKQVVQHVKLVVKSDEQHGKKGSDGKWHDAFLPASFKVKAGAKVVVSVVNYDDMAHSFHSKGLKTNAIIMPGTDKGKLTKFTFVAPKKQEVWGAIREGADTYLRRQLRSILPLIVLLTFALFLSVYIVPPSPEAKERFAGMDENSIRLLIGIARGIAFILGASFSLAVGQIGMRMAVHANVRVASAARRSFGDALRIAYRAGTITGMLTDGLGLFGGTLIFIIMGKAAPDALLGFGFGGTLLALFMRVGGGIFTKAADVGADLVGKVEAGIPEDDPRNPAVIADLVGDNVGDCAGMAADIFESYEVTIVSALILGLALTSLTGHIEWIIYPLLVRGIGVLSSIIGTYLVRGGPGKSGDAMKAIFTGFLSSAAISVVLFGIVALMYMQGVPGGWWRPFLATTVGVLLAILIDRLTEYFTGTHGAPVNSIKQSADTGPATLILSGVSVGYESSVWAIIVIAATIFASILIFSGVDVTTLATQAGISPEAARISFILYGVAMTGIGMLTLTGNNVAMDSYGPISDNANGIGEMAWHSMEDDETKAAQQIMADLDAVGNTTKAITKGVAIGSAVIAAVSLFGSFLVDVSRSQSALGIPVAQQIQSFRAFPPRQKPASFNLDRVLEQLQDASGAGVH